MECGSYSMTVSPKKKKPVYAALSVTHRAIELAVFSPKTMTIEQSFSVPMPEGLLDPELDTVQDTLVLKGLISQVLNAVKPKPSLVHLSLPGTLVRMVEMPKMDPSSLYVSLSSEAERYKTFDNTEAAVDFVMIDNPHLPSNMQQLVLGAVRSDTLSVYLKIMKELKVKVHTIGLEPLNVLRGMAGTGVLDSLVQQVGTDAHWGMILADPSRIRFSLWQCDKLLEFRELSMDTRNFANAANDPIVVEDLLEEIRRTTKTLQPVLWMTHNIPASLEEALSRHLGCPVRMAPVGNAIGLGQPLSLAAIGTAMSSVVPFPFDMDLAEGLGRSGGASLGPGIPVSDSGGSGEGESPAWLLPAGIGSLALGGVSSAILWLMAAMTGAQVPDLQNQVDSVKVRVAGLQSRQAELKRKAELDQSLIETIEKAKIRNYVYVSLTEDLRKKTPTEVWIQSLKVNDGMELAGKALNHKAVINFAKSFDETPYTKAVLIDSIVEGKMGGSLVYDFKISGGVNLDKSLLPKPENAEGQPSSESETTKPGA